jgi:hypothetical protein
VGFILGVIIFGLVPFLSKKSNQTEYILKKKKTETGRFKLTGFGSVQTDRFWFGSVQTDWFRLYDKNWFKPVCLGFFRLFFGLGSVRFFRLFFSVFTV